jgi:hypothetical protein
VITAVLEGLGAELLLALRQRLARIASREPRTSEQVTCSLRSASGSYGLTASWVSGIASLAPGEIRFTAGALERALAIASIGPTPVDTSRGLIRTARLTLHTAEGAVEISLQRGLIDRMRQALTLR